MGLYFTDHLLGRWVFWPMTTSTATNTSLTNYAHQAFQLPGLKTYMEIFSIHFVFSIHCASFIVFPVHQLRSWLKRKPLFRSALRGGPKGEAPSATEGRGQLLHESQQKGNTDAHRLRLSTAASWNSVVRLGSQQVESSAFLSFPLQHVHEKM